MSVYLWKQKHFLSIFILHIKKPRKLSYKVAFLFTQPWWLLNYEQFKIQSIHEQCTTFCGKKGTLTWQSGLWYVCRMTEWSSTPEACYRTQPWRWCDPRTCSSWGGCCCSERTGWLCRWPCLLVMYWTEHTWGWRFPWIWWCTTLLASLQHLDPLHLFIQITINIKLEIQHKWKIHKNIEEADIYCQWMYPQTQCRICASIHQRCVWRVPGRNPQTHALSWHVQPSLLSSFPRPVALVPVWSTAASHQSPGYGCGRPARRTVRQTGGWWTDAESGSELFCGSLKTNIYM